MTAEEEKEEKRKERLRRRQEGNSEQLGVKGRGARRVA